MIIALDSNVLLYAIGFARIEADLAKVEQAQALVARMLRLHVAVAVQALGEVYHVLIRSGMSRNEALDEVAVARSGARTLPTLPATFEAALEVAATHYLQIWDAIILASAAEAGARWLLSEDMHHGFVWRSTTVLNPFALSLPELLDRLGVAA